MSARAPTGAHPARAEWLVVGGPVERWEAIGLTVLDGAIPLFGTGIRIDPSAPPGLRRWALSGVAPSVVAAGGIDGLATDLVDRLAPVLVEHANGATSLDHVVVTTDSLERTCAAVADATAAPLKRVREAGELRQGFHRLGRGGLVVEVVDRAGLPTGPAAFWGLVLVVSDLDAAVATIGPDAIGEARTAVQPGRRIATVREAAGLGVPVAIMSPVSASPAPGI